MRPQLDIDSSRLSFLSKTLLHHEPLHLLQGLRTCPIIPVKLKKVTLHFMPPLSILSEFFRHFMTQTNQQPKNSLQGNKMCSDILGLTGKSHDKSKDHCKNCMPKGSCILFWYDYSTQDSTPSEVFCDCMNFKRNLLP